MRVNGVAPGAIAWPEDGQFAAARARAHRRHHAARAHRRARGHRAGGTLSRLPRPMSPARSSRSTAAAPSSSRKSPWPGSGSSLAGLARNRLGHRPQIHRQLHRLVTFRDHRRRDDREHVLPRHRRAHHPDRHRLCRLDRHRRVGVAILGMILFGEPNTLLRIGSILLIVAGIAGLKLVIADERQPIRCIAIPARPTTRPASSPSACAARSARRSPTSA